MKANKINVLLVLTIVVLSAVPLPVSYLLLDEVLDSAVSLSVNANTQGLLKGYRKDLKLLRDLDPKNSEVYRNRFFAIDKEILLYEDPYFVGDLLKESYRVYYFVLFVVVLLITLGLAIVMSRKIARSYRDISDRQIQQAKRIQELSHFDEWQEIAGQLAHEIKNPLTPIEMMMGNLNLAVKSDSRDQLEEKIKSAHEIVTEEVAKLKSMVNHFSSFSSLPVPLKRKTDLREYLNEFCEKNKFYLSDVNMDFLFDCGEGEGEGGAEGEYWSTVDTVLIGQCLLNLIINAVQANPNLKPLIVKIKLVSIGRMYSITVFNEGVRIPESEINRIFKMNFSSKKGKSNMGLGL